MKYILFLITFSLFGTGLMSEEIDTPTLLEDLQAQWETLSDYTCILETYSKKGEKEQLSTIEQKFLKPRWIRMQIIDGDGKGSIGVYDPITKKVRGCKTGILKIVVLTLELSDKRVSSIRGHRIDQSDCLTLIERLKSHNTRGELLSVERTAYKGKSAYLFTAEVQDSSRLWGAKEEKIWIDAESYFPLRVEQCLDDGSLVHYSTFRDIELNTGLTKEAFKL